MDIIILCIHSNLKKKNSSIKSKKIYCGMNNKINLKIK